MTLKTSLFSKGIFFNNLKRFKWGSLLYFIILFFAVPFGIMITDYSYSYLSEFVDSGISAEMILRGGYITAPFIFAIAVPVVASALIFRFIHSKNQGIASHILPVTRRKIYISTLAAAFCLMVIPVLLNALILFFVLLSKGFTDCHLVGYWLFINICILFIMFSISTFSALVTGHTAAHIVFNIFLHFIMPVIALTIAVISEVFLYGFVTRNDFIAEKILMYNPVVYFINNTNPSDDFSFFKSAPLYIYIAVAVVFYVLGYFLYKKRKVEAFGDVAAFKIFRPIVKYLITSVAAIVAFAIMYSSDAGAVSVVIVTVVASAIFYFAIEMLLKKSFRVFHLYKGFLGFMAACACVTLFFAYTSVFGYETRIPRKEDISGAMIYGTYRETPALLEGDEISELITKFHKELVSDIPVVDKDENNILIFSYDVSYDEWKKVTNELYEIDSYKHIISGIDELNIENVNSMDLIVRTGYYTHSIMLTEDAPEFLKKVKMDMDELSYDEMHESESNVNISMNIELSYQKNKERNVFRTDGYYKENESDINNEYRTKAFNFSINPNYKNTISFLKEKGYYDEIAEMTSEKFYFLKEPFVLENEPDKNIENVGYTREMSYKEEVLSVEEEKCVKISKEDARILFDMIFEGRKRATEAGEYYAVFCKSDSYGGMWLTERCIEFKKDELPDFLKKYSAE